MQIMHGPGSLKVCALLHSSFAADGPISMLQYNTPVAKKQPEHAVRNTSRRCGFLCDALTAALQQKPVQQLGGSAVGSA